MNLWDALPIGELQPDDESRRLIEEATTKAPCGRLLVGRGSDTYDPVCARRAGHTGNCSPEGDV